MGVARSLVGGGGGMSPCGLRQEELTGQRRLGRKEYSRQRGQNAQTQSLDEETTNAGQSYKRGSQNRMELGCTDPWLPGEQGYHPHQGCSLFCPLSFFFSPGYTFLYLTGQIGSILSLRINTKFLLFPWGHGAAQRQRLRYVQHSLHPKPTARATEGIATGGVKDVNTALREVLKTALIHDGLGSGIPEAAKTLDKGQVHLCVLSSSCDEPNL